MKKMFKFLLFLGVLGLVSGVVGYKKFILANYNYNNHGTTISQVFKGTISVLGDDNSLVVKAGSNVDWITLAGSGNRVQIEPGAIVGRIRGLGKDNIIIAPPDMELNTEGLKGENNQRRGDSSRSLDGF